MDLTPYPKTFCDPFDKQNFGDFKTIPNNKTIQKKVLTNSC